MREDDRLEIQAASSETPAAAILQGLKISNYLSVASVDDDVLAIFGLVKTDILTGKGVPWALGTDHVVKHYREFAKQSKIVVNQMLEICPRLENYCWAGSSLSINWLKWLGFRFDDSIPMGANGELFHRFHLER